MQTLLYLSIVLAACGSSEHHGHDGGVSHGDGSITGDGPPSGVRLGDRLTVSKSGRRCP